jgi:putative membrane protein
MKESDALLLVPVAPPTENIISHSSTLPSFSTLLREGVILQNEGSTARDHLANERTYLAWIRTALSISGVGLALLKWEGIANEAGYVVLSLGVLALITSTVRYLNVMRQLTQRQFQPNVRGALAVVAVILMAIMTLLVLQAEHKL